MRRILIFVMTVFLLQGCPYKPPTQSDTNVFINSSDILFNVFIPNISYKEHFRSIYKRNNLPAEYYIPSDNNRNDYVKITIVNHQDRDIYFLVFDSIFYSDACYYIIPKSEEYQENNALGIKSGIRGLHGEKIKLSPKEKITLDLRYPLYYDNLRGQKIDYDTLVYYFRYNHSPDNFKEEKTINLYFTLNKEDGKHEFELVKVSP